jgi:hypothetical protein
MVSPFIAAAFEGMLGITTATFYRLNSIGHPIGLVADINPLPTQDRTQLDMIDAESSPDVYDTTDNPLQDFSSATSNVHKPPVRMSITGTISSEINLGLLGSFGIGNIPGRVSSFRKDLQVLETLRAMGDRKEPIMVVTPRRTLPKAFITLIDPVWTPDLGQNTIVTINVKETRIVDPLAPGSVILDTGAMNTGNNANNPAGGQSGTPIDTQAVSAPSAPGGAPSVVATG